MSRFSTLGVLSALAAVPLPASAQADESPAEEWTIEPRGRLQLDLNDIHVPQALTAERFGTDGEVRRAYLGVDGTIPGNFGYRVEADFAASSVEFTDLYLTYAPAHGVTLTLGQHKPFFGLEEQTSDLFTSMLERAAFTSAFGFGRRIGFSGVYSRGDLIAQAGVFTVHTGDLDEEMGSYQFDGRVVFHPQVGSGVLHVGASIHLRELDGETETARYRARPFAHTTDTRLVDTGAILAGGERSVGAELAYIAGPFHATLEAHAIAPSRPGLPDPIFAGGYAEVGLLLTPGDKTSYEGGVYSRIRPSRPVDEGGIGAVQLNLRYDRLDLNDGSVTGGQQETLGLGAVWVPVDSVRFQANYGRLWISQAAIPAGDDADYRVDTLGLRAQFDF